MPKGARETTALGVKNNARETAAAETSEAGTPRPAQSAEGASMDRATAHRGWRGGSSDPVVGGDTSVSTFALQPPCSRRDLGPPPRTRGPRTPGRPSLGRLLRLPPSRRGRMRVSSPGRSLKRLPDPRPKAQAFCKPDAAATKHPCAGHRPPRDRYPPFPPPPLGGHRPARRPRSHSNRPNMAPARPPGACVALGSRRWGGGGRLESPEESSEVKGR